MRRHLPIALAFSALAALAVLSPPMAAAAADEVPAVPVDRQTPTKIMPVGDSITDGADEAQGGYRTDLWQLLRADNRPIDFVGSNSSGSTALGDRDNEGHGGYTITQVQNSIVPRLNEYLPDVVTLQIGTNDMYTDELAGAAPDRLSTLLDTITETMPEARVFVSSIPPMNNSSHNRANAFNATIPGMVAAKAADGQHVSFVDTNPAYSNPFDMIDAVHPNYGALSKGAAIWYAALTDVPTTRFEAEQTANATVVNAVRAQSTSASAGGKVGKIDFADSSVTFSFQVASAGTYRIRARASNGMNKTCSHKVQANGGASASTGYPSYSWDLYAVSAVDLPLVAGANKVKFTVGNCYAELDSIDVSKVPSA
ncbi:GDSL-type esterase/lipase family protein [Kribbella sp. NBC_01505]|uniref:GDSL-type esterase/lipase family protein n=1 Tax=Kribbella sp. NBC_01505 TaxID=2903580 RepID=UPI0038663D3A